MEAKESKQFRIGNLIEYHDDGTIFEIVEVDPKGLRVKNVEQETWIEYDVFSPIPLTEDWLTNWGFKKLDKSTYKTKLFSESLLEMGEEVPDYILEMEKIVKANFDIFTHPDLMNVSVFFAENGFNIYGFETKLKMRYVHQFQNLYYALTGTELEIVEK